MMMTCDDDDNDVDDEPEQGVRQKHQGDLRQHQVGGLFNIFFFRIFLFIFSESVWLKKSPEKILIHITYLSVWGEGIFSSQACKIVVYSV